MTKHVDEHELRALFERVEAPPGLDRWRERIADVHAEHVEPHADDPEPDDHEPDDDAPVSTVEPVVLVLPVGRELRPRRQRRRSVAVAAAAAVVVGLSGVVVAAHLVDERPPADPTMIIGPDRTASVPPPSDSPIASSTDASRPPASEQPDHTTGTGPSVVDGPSATGSSMTVPQRIVPAWPPLTGDPTATNTGVPFGAVLRDHYGDLRITTAGEVVTDLRVTGAIIVDAPGVTLRRVLVVAPYGAAAVRQNAADLTIDDSELTGGRSVTQYAPGLVISRSRLEAGATVAARAQVRDSYLGTADVLVPAGSGEVVLRHNAMGRVTMNDLDSPIRGVLIENSLLTQVDAPTMRGSASIHVLRNRFRGNAPSTGWNAAGIDYRWADNTFADGGAAALP